MRDQIVTSNDYKNTSYRILLSGQQYVILYSDDNGNKNEVYSHDLKHFLSTIANSTNTIYDFSQITKSCLIDSIHTKIYLYATLEEIEKIRAITNILN